MKPLLIQIVGHQTMPDPALHLSLQIADSVYQFDSSSTVQTWQWFYDDSLISRHDAMIRLHNKQYLIDHDERDLSDLCYVIDSISFDGKDVTDILQTCAQYCYLDPESGAEVTEPYTNWLGLDGKLEFQLVTPLFCWWLLDYKF